MYLHLEVLLVHARDITDLKTERTRIICGVEVTLGDCCIISDIFCWKFADTIHFLLTAFDWVLAIAFICEMVSMGESIQAWR